MVKLARPASEQATASGLRTIGAALLLVAATVLAYGPALPGGMLWDDEAHVTKPALRSLAGLARIWFEPGATQQYYPLLHSAFWLEHRLWGDAMLGYHLTSVLLHATAALLVVALVRRLLCTSAGSSVVGDPRFYGKPIPPEGGTTNAIWRRHAAWLAGALFALHPVAVESVAWISEQKNTLSAVFYLSAALVYLRFDRERRGAQYAGASAIFVLALLTKTVTATLPAALLVVFWWQRGRLDLRRDVRPLLPWFVLGIATGLWTAYVERAFIGAQGADYMLTFVERGLVAGRALWFYLGKLLWPVDLMFIYPRWTIDAGVGWQWLFPLGFVALTVAVGWLARRRRGPFAGLLIFAGTLFPALGFFNVYPFLYSYVADHFQYLARLGVIVPLAVSTTWATRRISVAVRAGLAAALLATLGVQTWRECGSYRDADTLYRETLRRNPACWMAHINLGNSIATQGGSLPEAMAHFEEALRLKPDFPIGHNSLGNALSMIPGREDEALAHYEEAVRLRADYPEAQFNLGVVLAGRPVRLVEGVAHLELAVRMRPDFAEAHFYLGVALLKFPERTAESLLHLETARRLRPDWEAPRRALDQLQAVP